MRQHTYGSWTGWLLGGVAWCVTPLSLVLSCHEPDEPTGASSWFPATCDAGVSPYLSEGCIPSLVEACRKHASAGDCDEAPPLDFDEGGYVVRCVWTKVVAFADPETCGGPSVTGRCEAGVIPGFGCIDACSGPPEYLRGHQITPEGELVERGCSPEGLAISLFAGEHYGIPGDPPPPALRECWREACDAQ